MLINTIDKNIDLNFIADEIDEDIRFMVLDFTNQPDLDYIYTPLVFLESFNAPCAILEIGKYNLEVPLDWNVIIADQFLGQSEIISIMQIADRGFNAFSINPNHVKPEFLPINLKTVYNEKKWFLPKLKTGHMLAIPLELDSDSLCVFFAKDLTKINEVIQIDQLWL